MVEPTVLAVRAEGRPLDPPETGDDALAAHTTASFGGDPSAVIPASTTKILQIDITRPASAMRHLPRHVGNHISYALALDSPLASFVGSDTVHQPVL